MTVTPFIESPLGGFQGVTTGSVYTIDPVSGIPLEPLLDTIPSFLPTRVAFDMVQNEDWEQAFSVTTANLQDFGDATIHVKPELETMTIVGVLTATIITAIGVAIPSLAGIPNLGATGFRPDLIRLNNLIAMAKARQQVLAVTPNRAIARALIERIAYSWNADQGEEMIVSLSLKEARIVSPLDVTALIDEGAMAGGNVAATGGGGAATAPASPPGGTPPPSAGVGPTF